jgi:ribonuclease HI
MIYDPHALKIYVDGSAITNPGKMVGIGMVIVYPESDNKKNDEFSLGYHYGTNQTMEMNAYLEALKKAIRLCADLKYQRVIIYSDSWYVCENIFRAQTWKKNKWKNKDGKSILNNKHWDELLKTRAKLRIPNELIWHKGKSNELVKRVDGLAKQGARSNEKTIDSNLNSSRVTRKVNKLNKLSLPFPACGQSLIIRAFEKKYLGNKNDMMIRVKFEVQMSGEIISYTAEYSENDFHIKRGNYYLASFNSDPKNPKIIQVIPSDCKFHTVN